MGCGASHNAGGGGNSATAERLPVVTGGHEPSPSGAQMLPRLDATDEDGLVKLKVLMVGEAGVGKSSLLLNFTENRFASGLGPTIGVDFQLKTVTVRGEKVRLEMWDTAGQDRYRTVTNKYFRGGHAFFIVYDITNRQSFERGVPFWLDEVNKNAGAGVVKFLIGNKVDRGDIRDVLQDEGQRFAADNDMLFFETSAKDGTNVPAMFNEAAKAALDRYQR